MHKIWIDYKIKIVANHKVNIQREELEKLYWNQQMSTFKIGKLYYCSHSTIRNRILELGIPIKSSSIARMRYRKSDFSGDLVEKAYMIGFRLGDLNVYQVNIHSELIVARCNTTHKVQIDLIRDLFSKYGKVTISPGAYSTNINCYLNKTFDFLIPKYNQIPNWLVQSKLTAIAFIAGYTDAEGNFILNQTRARFKIDSYDLEILTWISDWLQKQGVRVKFRCISKKGDLRTNGTRFNNDLWRINVNEAFSLLRFIRYIKPFTKHKTRLRDMIICERNIKKRIKNRSIKYAPI